MLGTTNNHQQAPSASVPEVVFPVKSQASRLDHPDEPIPRPDDGPDSDGRLVCLCSLHGCIFDLSASSVFRWLYPAPGLPCLPHPHVAAIAARANDVSGTATEEHSKRRRCWIREKRRIDDASTLAGCPSSRNGEDDLDVLADVKIARKDRCCGRTRYQSREIHPNASYTVHYRRIQVDCTVSRAALRARIYWSDPSRVCARRRAARLARRMWSPRPCFCSRLARIRPQTHSLQSSSTSTHADVHAKVVAELDSINAGVAVFDSREDAEAYRPERWIEEGGGLKKHMLTFGSGPRACIGKNLAYIPMQLALATVLLRYEFTMQPDVTELRSVEGLMHRPLELWLAVKRRGIKA
uniref:Cytochrome P450 n=1 Tax=Mycena chlorophos TaxID=658473 RepID=A0ABQ0LZW7_MYCCL|nr:cytochrome P450 [Mycena chlorophos]